MTCYRPHGCGPYEMLPCNECPASKPEYLKGEKKKMPGGRSRLFPSLEASRQEQVEKEKKLLPNMVRKVALYMGKDKSLPVPELVEALEICNRNGLHTLKDVFAAYKQTEEINDEN